MVFTQKSPPEDEELRLHSEKLKLLVQLSKEEAIMAKEQSSKSKMEVANMVKTESHQLKKKVEQQMQVEVEQKQKLVESIQSTRETVKEVKEKILKGNKERALEVEREKEQLRQRRQQAEEEERLRRQELIKQIRAMEIAAAAALADRNQKLVDLTETSGFGILGEMSILELQERLNMLKIREQEEEDLRRHKIIEDKQQKQSALFEKMKRVERFRAVERVKEHERARSREAAAASVMSYRTTTTTNSSPEKDAPRPLPAALLDMQGKQSQVQQLQNRLAELRANRMNSDRPNTVQYRPTQSGRNTVQKNTNQSAAADILSLVDA